jgi:eukaryotic-like serine/threonine-protein kinase
MGIVYKAHDELMDRHVAIKTMAGDMAGSPELRKRFSQEARLAARLNHPHIIKIFDMGESDGHIYIAMELLEGQDLKAYIRTGRSRPMHKLHSWLVQLADAIAFAHKQGIIHRDIKPANVHITQENNLVLMDFGIARASSSRITGDGAIIGTPEYISPEQVLALEIDHRADIFSLGLVYYEMLTRVHPFRSSTLATTIHRILHERPAPPKSINSRIPDRLSNLVLKCMEKEAKYRYHDCRSLLHELKSMAP